MTFVTFFAFQQLNYKLSNNNTIYFCTQGLQPRAAQKLRSWSLELSVYCVCRFRSLAFSACCKGRFLKPVIVRVLLRSLGIYCLLQRPMPGAWNCQCVAKASPWSLELTACCKCRSLQRLVPGALNYRSIARSVMEYEIECTFDQCQGRRMPI